MPAIGQMRERVTLQQENSVSDGQGGKVLAWAEVATFWARVEPVRGGEQLAAMRLEASQEYRVTIRQRTGVTAGMRLVWGTKNLNIRTLTNPDERGRFLQLICTEGVAT